MDYFTRDTDVAISQFNTCVDSEEKNKIFDSSIRPAFEKLIESQIYVYQFYSIDAVDTLKMEALTNLYEMLPKYDSERGTKGFSYFNVVCKNWFIHKSRENSLKLKRESEIFYDIDHEIAKGDPNFSINPHESDLEERERWKKFFQKMDTWKKFLTKDAEKQVLESVSFIMQHPDLVSIYNKKAVLLYLREMTGLTTKQVIQHLKRIQELYYEWTREFNETGESD